MSFENLTRNLSNLWQNEQTRNQLLGGIGALVSIGGAMAAYAFLREPMRVNFDRLTIHLPNAKGNIPAEGLRVLHLSDTHFRGAEWREQAKIDCIRKACNGLDYDLLIHTGDFLHYDSGLPNVLTLLDALPKPRLGGYAVFGNHDYTTYSHGGMLSRAWANFQTIQHDAVPIQEVIEGKSAKGTAAGIANPYAFHRAHNETSLRSNSSNGNGNHHAHSNGNGNGNGNNSSGTGERIVNGNVKGHHAGISHRHATPLDQARTLYEFGQYCASAPFDLKRTGKNDCNALESALAARNIYTLHNRYIHLNKPELGIDLYLAGVDDVVEGTPELPKALAEIPKDAPTILLSHNPDILVEPGIEQVDLVLSGHTHGGQIVLPLLGAAHTQSMYLGRKEVSGYLRRGNTQVYITRGVGEGIPLRFGAAPQITLITILPA